MQPVASGSSAVVHKLHWPAAALVLAATCGNTFADGVTVCEPILPGTEIRAGLSRNETATFRAAAGELAPRRTSLAIDWRASERFSAGIAHRYNDLNIDALPIRGNGHLHTIWLPLRYQWGAKGNRVTVALAPAVSATSNTVRRPGRWKSGDLQWLGAATWSHTLDSGGLLHAGLCRDFRAGRGALYPLLRYDGQAGRWHYRAGFPESSLTRVLGDRVDAGLLIAPSGNRWRAYAADFLASSPLEHRAWLAALRIGWRPSGSIELGAFAGTEFANRWRLKLADGTSVELRSDAALRAGLEFRWQF